jgi:hypothetical protein
MIGFKFKLDADTKHLIEEVSALSGIQRDVIKEVLEALAIRWVEAISQDATKLNRLVIPYLGTIACKYTGDKLGEDNSLEPQVEVFATLSDNFKGWMGDAYDEKHNFVLGVLDTKINEALEALSSPDI